MYAVFYLASGAGAHPNVLLVQGLPVRTKLEIYAFETYACA
jgi:hypothetical protein